jgi:hypothetical protein
MNDHPDTLELLRIASQTLTADILPQAEPAQLYTLRMIANALGIATREIETHDKNVADETRSLNALYAESKPITELQARNRQLAQNIRHGTFEDNPARTAELRQHLLATTRAKLAAAYPKALDLVQW